MFLVANFALKKSSFEKNKNIQTYSIAIGIVFYAAIYMYLLFSKSEFLTVFNRFIIYIIGVDLLLSALFFSKKTPDIVIHDISKLSNSQLDQIYGTGINDNNEQTDTESFESEESETEESDTESKDERTDNESEANLSEINETEQNNNSNAHEAHDTQTHPTQIERVIKEEFKDDLETLVLDNDLVEELGKISAQGPKKRGRKPKAALLA